MRTDAVPPATGIAIVDPGSFVLPYDFQLVKALAARGEQVDFHGSTTRYNEAFLQAMRGLPNVGVRTQPISGSVVSRWRGALGYLRLALGLLREADRYHTIDLQFSGFWPIDLPVFALLRRKFVFTVHNAVPHGHAGSRHLPTGWLARIARALVFVSESTRDDFIRRYGERYRSKASVLPHGLLTIAPADGTVPYIDAPAPTALVFWGIVQRYKGVELFGALARHPQVVGRGLALEIHGAWDRSLGALRDELAGLGIRIVDRYLDAPELHALLMRDVVFVLPYHAASQSGALYALLNQGRFFLCSDVGDLGAFMRAHGLEGLLLKDRSAAAVLDCLQYLQTHHAEVIAALRGAQAALRWDRLLDAHGRVLGLR